jgi:hypothetical protein
VVRKTFSYFQDRSVTVLVHLNFRISLYVELALRESEREIEREGHYHFIVCKRLLVLERRSSRVPTTHSLQTHLDSCPRSGSNNASAGRGSAGSLVTALPRQTSPGHGDVGSSCQPGIAGEAEIPLRSSRCLYQLPNFATVKSRNKHRQGVPTKNKEGFIFLPSKTQVFYIKMNAVGECVYGTGDGAVRPRSLFSKNVAN